MFDAASNNDAAPSTTTPCVRAFFVVSALLLSCACATVQEPTRAQRAPSVDDEALRELAREQTHRLAGAVQMYWFRHQVYPSTEEGLRALLSPPDGEPLLEELPRDPWGRELAYRRPGITGNDFDVYSLGPDGEPGTADDVGSWERRRPTRKKSAPSLPSPRPPPPPSGGPRVIEL